MEVQPYLTFNGRCEEAVAFYKAAVGAEVVMMMRFKEAPDPNMAPPGLGDKVMHAALKVGDNMVLASDGNCQGEASFTGFSLSLTAGTDAEATKFFDALADGGKVGMPLMRTFFASSFGSLTDRFGVPWMIYVPAQPPAQQ